MNLGELKKSLSRMPPDADDFLVVLHNKNDSSEEKTYSLLAGVGYIKDPVCVVLFDETVAKELIIKQAAKAPINKPNEQS